MSKRISTEDLRCADARRICVIKPSALGDVVQTLPLLPVLKERFPRASISWVINSNLAELLTGHAHLDEIIRYRRHGSWSDWRTLLRRLRRRKFDLVFDLQGLFRTGLMTWATRARLRVGLETAREGAGWACQLTLPDSGRLVPAHLRYWRVAEELGLGDRCREPRIPFTDAQREWAELRLKRLRRPLLAVHPGTRWITKRWPIENFAVIVSKAVRYFGFSVAILGSRDELPQAKQLEHLLRRFVPAAGVETLAGETNLKQLASVLNLANVLLTNDSGPMHLAAGVGTPVVGVFTCTDSDRSGPPGDRHELVASDLACAPCYQKRCRLRGSQKMACLDDVSTDRVWRAFVRLMDKQKRLDRAA